MHTTAQDLPAELWLSILRNVPTYDLFKTLRLVDHRSMECADDIFRNELLPNLQISIRVSLASEYPLRPGGHAAMLFRFERMEMSDAGVETMRFTLQSVEPSTRRGRALVKLRQSVHADALTDWQVFQIRSPPDDSVTLHGRAWHELALKGVDPDVELHESGEILRLDWRKLMSTYLYLLKSKDEFVAGI